MAWGTITKVVLMVVVLAVLGFVVLPRIWDMAASVVGWGDISEEEVDPNLVSLLKADNAEVLSYKEYYNWEGSWTTAESAGGKTTINLIFDKPVELRTITEAFVLYREKCTGYESSGQTAYNTCAVAAKDENDYEIVANRPVVFAFTYLEPGNKQKLSLSITDGYPNQDFIFKLKKEYIEGYCGSNCVALDTEGHYANPATVLLKFST